METVTGNRQNYGMMKAGGGTPGYRKRACPYILNGSDELLPKLDMLKGRRA